MSKSVKQVSRKLAYWASVSAIGLVVGISLQLVHANWTAPTGAAPAGNVGAPINTQGGQTILGTNGPTLVNGALGSGGAFVAYSTAVFDGNVGIGTTTPADKLDVAGVIGGQSLTGSGDVLKIGNDTKLVDIDIANTTGLYGMEDATQAGIKLGSNGGTLYGSGGNVGIGTTSPSRTLDVNGYARIRSINGEGGTIQLDGNNNTTVYVENINGTFRLVNSPWNSQLFAVDQSGNTVANGMLQTNNGGVKFPDGSVQTTAASGGGQIQCGNVSKVGPAGGTAVATCDAASTATGGGCSGTTPTAFGPNGSNGFTCSSGLLPITATVICCKYVPSVVTH